jgi:hypothetical protein
MAFCAMSRNQAAEHAYIERCADAFMAHLDQGTFDSHVHEWTVFGGEVPCDPLGFYKDYKEALTAGYKAYGLASFLVREIKPEYRIFGRRGAPIIASSRMATLIDPKTKRVVLPCDFRKD